MKKEIDSLRGILLISAFTIIFTAFFVFLSNDVAQELPFYDIEREEVEEENKNIVLGNNKFAFDLYQKLDHSKNIFFSPYSIFSALSIVYEGADGETAKEINDVLYLPEKSILRKSFKAVYDTINKKEKEYLLSTGNALWAQKDYAFLEDYINLVEKDYSARVTNLDFIKETELSRTTINEYIEKQTEEKIKDLIPQGVLGPLTRLVITNAIYFKGDWKFQFEKEKTKEMDFYVSVDETVKTEMMFMEIDDTKFNYFEDEDLEIIELPYKEGEVSMLILLPKKDIKEVESSLSFEVIEDYKSRMEETSIDAIYLPKFELDTKYFIKDILISLGINSAFIDGLADFSKMDGTKNLVIDSVIHQAYVGIDEEGTEAAAATAVVMRLTSAMPEEEKIFNANRPFIFFIEEKETKAILFVGKLNNPEN